jgi:hypothetical protein
MVASCCNCLGKTAKAVTRPLKLLSPFDWFDYPQIDERVPDNIVMVNATKPDWTYTDVLVFELHSGEIDDEEEGVRKAGLFYSGKRRALGIGHWKMISNVLYLCWPGDVLYETVTAITSTRHWYNDQTHLKLAVTAPKPESPWWFMPDRGVDQAESVESKWNSEDFECPVCTFELHKFNVATVRRFSRRTCRHYFHHECASYLLRESKGKKRGASCPVCGVCFSEAQKMPSLQSDPRGWFGACDADFGGELSDVEVIEALGAVLPVNRKKLEKNVRGHWHEWDPDGDGTITLQEFCMPGTGMRDWMLGHIDLLQSAKQAAGKEGTISHKDIPKLDHNPLKWFRYWDTDKSGTLERDELIRSLIRTFCVDALGKPLLTRAFDMRESASCIWQSLGYSPFDQVNFDEFVKPYGLMDQFVHNQMNCMFVGMDDDLWIQ